MGTLLEELESTELLAMVLLMAEHFDDAFAYVRSVSSTEVLEGIAVAAVAATRGADAARRELERTASADARTRVAAAAGLHLLQVRRYPEAVALMAAAADRTSQPSQIRAAADAWRKLSRIDGRTFDPSEPHDLIHRVYAGIARGDEAMVRAAVARASRPQTLVELAPDARALSAFIETAAGVSLSPAVVVDAFLSMAKVDVLANGPRVWVVRTKSQPPAQPFEIVAFAVRERGAMKVLALRGAPEALGDLALARLRARDVAGAADVLDLVRAHGWVGEPPTWFQSQWSKATPRDSGSVGCAAAALSVTSDHADERAMTLLARCAEREGAAGKAARLRHAQLLSERGAFDQALAVLGEQPSEVRTILLGAAGKFAEAERAIDAAAGDGADEATVVYQRAVLAWQRGDYARARKLYTARWDASHGGNGANQAAWMALFSDGVDDQALALARAAVTASQRSSATLNTLAAVLAARGDYREAYETLAASMAADNALAMRPQDLLVYGRSWRASGSSARRPRCGAPCRPSPGSPRRSRHGHWPTTGERS